MIEEHLLVSKEEDKNMDESREILFDKNLVGNEEIENDDTIPLNDVVDREDDSPKQIVYENLNTQALLNEMRNFKDEYKEYLREITHDFLTYQKEVVESVNQIRQDVEAESHLIKDRISKIEDRIEKNEHAIAKIYDTMKQNTNPTTNIVPHLDEDSNTITEGYKRNTNKNTTDKTQKPTIVTKENVFDKNQNYAVLDNQVTRISPVPSKPSNVTLKPQLYEGDEDLDEYLAQFEILAEINGWDYTTKSLYLAGSLKGGARALLNELDKETRKDYDSLVMVLNKRYGSAEKSELFRAKLQSRVRGKDESLPELAQSIKKLTRQAYPHAPCSLTSVLTLEHFIDAIPDPEMRLRLREASPKTVNEAETLAVRLETLKLAERQKGRLVRTAESAQNHNYKPNHEEVNEGETFRTLQNDFSSIRQELSNLTRELRGLTHNQNRGDHLPKHPPNNYPKRNFNGPNKNFGQGNRLSNQGSRNFGPNKQPSYHNFQGNQWRSNSGVGARPSPNGPSQ